MNRLHNLDYLRGLAAFGIMIYHYLSAGYGAFSSNSLTERVGVYGVSIFYVLSGLTLYYVYYQKMLPSKADVMDFFKKRVFRIFPLLWLATIASAIITSREVSAYSMLLNLTGLFGFIKWDDYYATGAWSIGNELVFYCFFPFFILFAKRYRWLFALFSIAIFATYLVFAFGILKAEIPMGEQWRNYVNPLNQVFLFLSGFLMGYFFKQIQLKSIYAIAFIVSGLLIFFWVRTPEDPIHLVTGINRLLFTLACLLICFGFYKFKTELPSVISSPLALLGEASYSVYLLHPIVNKSVGIVLYYLKNYGVQLPTVAVIILSTILSLVTSYFVYRYFEKYFMKLGKGKQPVLATTDIKPN